MRLLNGLNNASSYAVSVLRVGRGLGSKSPCQALPEIPLQLYEFESCPFCRKVRETLSELNLEYISRTSARGSTKRAQIDKQQFPYLVDPNTDERLYESEDIIDYLRATYGKKRAFCWRLISPVNTIGSAVASAIRPRGGSVARHGRDQDPEQLLVLYNMEGSPYCRKVREVLCELDLDYHVKNACLPGSVRDELVARGGRKTVPYLVDSNTGKEMYESNDIVAYLRATYG